MKPEDGRAQDQCFGSGSSFLLLVENECSATKRSMMSTAVAYRQVRALYTEDTITVYQAYSHTIADAALAAGTFTEPSFKMDRMTWIKPSFLWMAYRCGYAKKDKGQERVLAIEITREGFEWALSHACLSHWDKDVDATIEAYNQRKATTPVRVQWDPERDLQHKALSHRSIQIGLSKAAVKKYVNEWIVSIRDVTEQTQQIGELVAAGEQEAAERLLPAEKVYGLPEAVAKYVGATIECGED